MMPRIKNKRTFYKPYSELSRQQQRLRWRKLMNHLLKDNSAADSRKVIKTNFGKFDEAKVNENGTD